MAGPKRRSLKCPEPGCERAVNETEFESEEALAAAHSLVRKPLAVERIFSGLCRDHGKVWVAEGGHHISSPDTIGYEADEEWKVIAFAVRNAERKF